jgi:hypothetical protein
MLLGCCYYFYLLNHRLLKPFLLLDFFLLFFAALPLPLPPLLLKLLTGTLNTSRTGSPAALLLAASTSGPAMAATFTAFSTALGTG